MFPLLWRNALKKIPTLFLLALIWGLAFAIPQLPLTFLIPCNALLWCSAILLAPGKIYGPRLVKAALIFATLWSAIIGALYFFASAEIAPLFRLWGWLALGLHLMLAKTPLELALVAGKIFSPLIGKARGQKLALALALLARLIPRLIDSGFKIKKSLALRCGQLPLKTRVALWGGAIMRDAFGRSEELARALLKRWPW